MPEHSIPDLARMPGLFATAEACLFRPEVEAKLECTRAACSTCLGRAEGEHVAGQPRPIAETVFPKRPVWVDPRALPRRRLGSVEGRIALLHAVAHIEFMAIHLAWDHLYRFRGMPAAYYRDWLEVAGEEAEHFVLLRDRLRALGADYGDLPVHGGLWSVAVDTALDLPARMALVPRYMEARGLDVTPGMIERLQEAGDSASVAVLQRILADEVGHVAKGTRWFHAICAERGLNPAAFFFETVTRYFRGGVRGPFNWELRLAAGFTAEEIRHLERVGAARLS